MDPNLYTRDEATGSWIAKDFKCGSNFKHGLNCILEPDVIVGDDVSLGHDVHLKSGTRVYNDVEISDHCMTTGISIIGNHVRIRTASCISKSVIVNDWVFIAAGIMSSHTKNVYHGRPNMDKRQYVTQIGYGCIIGSRTNMMAGVKIAPGSIVGYDANVIGSLTEHHGIYINKPNPWATLQKTIAPDDPWYIEVPEDYQPYQFDAEMLKTYLPFYRG